MEKLHYILGKGELLTESIVVKRKSFDRKYPYTFSESVERLTPQFSKASFDLNSLPDEACPFGLAMETITLNPSFIAKSYFPNDLFRELGLDSIGSSNETITPERWLKKEPPKSTITTKLFVAGFRSALSNVPSAISEFQPESSEAKDLQKIESVSTHNPVKYNEHDLLGEQVFEVVLNWAPSFTLKDLQRSFLKYAKLCSVTTHPDLAFSTGLLWFIPVSGTAINMKALSKFSLVRVVRLMPKLRTLPFREKRYSLQIA